MNSSHATLVRYQVLAFFCAAAAIAYIQRNGLGVAVPLVKADLEIGDKLMGLVMGSFFATYSLVQVPAAALACRWQTRKALTLFAVLWSLATVAIATAPTWHVLLAAQLAMGAAQAGLFPAATLSLTAWLPVTRRGLSTGALASFMSVGSAAGTRLAGNLLTLVSWRWMFILYALSGFLWAACFHFWFRNDPSEHRRVNPAELDLIQSGRADASSQPSKTPSPTPWRILLSSPAMWCICGQHIFRAAGYIFYASWFPTYLREARGVTLQDSGNLASLPLAAVIVGSPLGGIVSDWILNRTGSRRLGRQVFASVCMLFCAGLILAAWRVHDARLAAYVIAAGSFCAAFGGPCAYAITMDMGGKQVAAVFSTMNAVGGIGAFSFPVVVPWIRDAGGWDAVLFTFAGIYVAAAACWVAFDARGTIVPQTAIAKPQAATE
jgi:sugar phosphate permease